MEQYGMFASVYDAYMEDVPYSMWVDILISKLQAHGIAKGAEVLDLACGTANIAIPLAKAGYQVTGMDASGYMLSVAAQKARENDVSITFVLGNMLRFEMPYPVDVITCIFDAVNYLENIDDIKTFITCAKKALKPGGLLLFDISTKYHLQEVIGDHAFAADHDIVSYIWANTVDERGLQMDLTLFIQQEDNVYHRYEETHFLAAHEEECIEQQLLQQGFSCEKLDFMENTQATGQTLRLLYIAQKKGNRDERENNA